MKPRLRAIRVLTGIESEEPIYDYTGRMVKQLIYTLNKEIRLFHGMKGILTPVALSSPFTPGKEEYQLGEPLIPRYENVERDGYKEHILVPVKPDDKYLIHIGGIEEIVLSIKDSLEKQMNKGPITIVFNKTLVTFNIEAIQDVTETIMEKDIIGDQVIIYLKSPAMIFNVFAATRLPKFSPSAVEVLMTPFMYTIGAHTMDYRVLIEASKILGYLVETWYTPRTLKPVLLPFKNKKEVALAGRIKYIIDIPKGKHKTKELIKEILRTAEITGIGESRLNGFGTIVFNEPKS